MPVFYFDHHLSSSDTFYDQVLQRLKTVSVRVDDFNGMADPLQPPLERKDNPVDEPDEPHDHNKHDIDEPLQQMQREANTSAHAGNPTPFPNSTAAAEGETSDTGKRTFGDSNDSADEASGQDTSSFSSPPKRTRRETASRTKGTSPISPSSHSFQELGPASSQSSQIDPALPSSITSSQNIPPIQSLFIQRHASPCNNDRPNLTSGENAYPGPCSSSTVQRPQQGVTASTGRPGYTQDDQPTQASSNEVHAEISSSDEDVSAPPSGRRRRSTRRGGRVGHGSHAGNSSHELTSFPPSSTTLPAGLTLEEICDQYPNHLNREHLRPFILGNWSARRLWQEMNSSARRNTSASRPWNYLEHRLHKERKRMNKEQEYAQGQEGGTQQQPNPFLAGRPSMQPSSSPLLSGNQNQFSVEATGCRRFPQGQEGGTQQQSSGSAGDCGYIAQPPSFPTSIGNQNQADVGSAVAQLRGQFRAETAEQRQILSDILAVGDPRWHLRSQRERNGLVEQEWLRRIRRLERSFVRDHDMDAHGLDIPQATVEEMLRRLNALVQMRIQAAAPSVTDGASVQVATPAGNARLMALQQQLLVLQGWTTAWRAELQQRGGHSLGGRGTVPRARSFAAGTPGQSRQRHSVIPAPAPSNGYVRYTPTPRTAPPPAHASSQEHVRRFTPVHGNATAPSSSSAMNSVPSQETNDGGRLPHENDPTLPQMPRTPDETRLMGVEDSSKPPAGQEDSETKNAQTDAADPQQTDDDFSYQAFLENDDVPGDNWVGEASKKEESP